VFRRGSKGGYLKAREERDALRRERRKPAFFIEALLSQDIPPYLTNQRGAQLDFADDPIASDYQKDLDIDPASL